MRALLGQEPPKSTSGRKLVVIVGGLGLVALLLFGAKKLVGGGGDKAVLKLVPLIKPRLGGFPPWLLLGWIRFESSGRVAELTTSIAALGGEAGLFQLDASNRKSVGADIDRILKDPVYAIETGVAYMKKVGDFVQKKLGIGPGSDLYYWSIKLVHAIGSGGAKAMYDDMRANGTEPSSILQVTDYFARGTEADSRIARKTKHFASKGIERTNGALKHGRRLVELANQAAAEKKAA